VVEYCRWRPVEVRVWWVGEFVTDEEVGVTVGDSAAGVSTVGVDYRLQAAGVGRAGGVVPGRSWRMMRWRKKEAGGGVGEARGSRAAKAQRCARTNDVSCSRNDGN
jgi:hypothetical protein